MVGDVDGGEVGLDAVGGCVDGRVGSEAAGLPIIQAPFGTGGSRITALAVRVGSGHKEPSSDPGPNLH